MRSALLFCSALLVYAPAIVHAAPLVQVEVDAITHYDIPETRNFSFDPAAFTHPDNSIYLSADYVYAITPIALGNYTYDRFDISVGSLGGNYMSLYSGDFFSPTSLILLQFATSHHGGSSCMTLQQNASGTQVPTFSDDSCVPFQVDNEPPVDPTEFVQVGSVDFAVPTAATPEPGTLLLVGPGLVAAAVRRRFRA